MNEYIKSKIARLLASMLLISLSFPTVSLANSGAIVIGNPFSLGIPVGKNAFRNQDVNLPFFGDGDLSLDDSLKALDLNIFTQDNDPTKDSINIDLHQHNSSYKKHKKYAKESREACIGEGNSKRDEKTAKKLNGDKKLRDDNMVAGEMFDEAEDIDAKDKIFKKITFIAKPKQKTKMLDGVIVEAMKERNTNENGGNEKKESNQEKLDSAALRGDIKSVKEILSEHHGYFLGINVTTNTLNNAARSGSVELMEYLIDYYRWSPVQPTEETLHNAILSRNVKAVNYLMKGFGLLPTKNMLSEIVDSDDLGMKAYMFDPEKKILNSIENHILSKMRYPQSHPPLELEKKYNVLRYAASHGDLETVSYLLESWGKYYLNQNIFDAAVSSGNSELIGYLMELLFGPHCLIDIFDAMVIFNDPDLVKHLVVNKSYDVGFRLSTLESAARSGNLELVKMVTFLVTRNKNIIIKDDDKSRIIYKAVSSGNLEMVRYFIRIFGFDSIRGLPGTILSEAASSSNGLELVKYLLAEYKIDRFERDRMMKMLKNMVEGAASSGDARLVLYLIDNYGIPYYVQGRGSRLRVRPLISLEDFKCMAEGSCREEMIDYFEFKMDNFEEGKYLLKEEIRKKKRKKKK